MPWTLDQDKDKVLENLQNASLETVCDKDYHRSLYKNIIPKSSVKRFLKSTGLYNSKKRRWDNIPEDLDDLDELGSATFDIMEAILLGLTDEDQQASRQVVNTRNKTTLRHYHQGDTWDGKPRSSPVDLVIKADGSSFENPTGYLQEVGYENATTCAMLVKDDLRGGLTIKDEAAYLKLLGVHAREIRLHQPNRQFVRLLLISPTGFRLCHFDRAGCQWSEGFDLHKDAELFINLVLGLSAKDEATLGFDTTIRWEVKNGRKVSGTIETYDLEGEPVVYDMVSVKPMFMSTSLCGRGSICWKVKDRQTGEVLVLKDAWMRPNTTPEWEALECVKGVPGVIQMVSYEKEHANISDFRAMDPFHPIICRESPGYSTIQGIQERTVTKLYGKGIRNFNSELQLIGALRDCVAALSKMYLEKGLIHRDISPANILLGIADTAEPGERGCLIDLDYAISIDRLRSGQNMDPVGTRFYQSIQVLMRIMSRICLRHDHLDDLESLYWVTTELVYERRLGHADEKKFEFRQGSSVYGFLEDLRKIDAGQAIKIKKHFLSDWPEPEEYEDELQFDLNLWSPATQELLKSFHHFINEIVTRKLLCPFDKLEELSEQLHESAEEHFNTVLGFFDKALQELEASEKAKASKSSTGEQVTKDNTKDPHGKRAREQQDDAAPPAKRSRTALNQASQRTTRVPQRRTTRASTSQRVERKKVTSFPARATRSRTRQEEEDTAPVAQRTRAKTQPTATRSQGTTKKPRAKAQK